MSDNSPFGYGAFAFDTDTQKEGTSHDKIISKVTYFATHSAFVVAINIEAQNVDCNSRQKKEL